MCDCADERPEISEAESNCTFEEYIQWVESSIAMAHGIPVEELRAIHFINPPPIKSVPLP